MFEVTGAYRPCVGGGSRRCLLGREGVGRQNKGLELCCLYLWKKEGEFFVFGNEEIRFTGIFVTWQP